MAGGGGKPEEEEEENNKYKNEFFFVLRLKRSIPSIRRRFVSAVSAGD